MSDSSDENRLVDELRSGDPKRRTAAAAKIFESSADRIHRLAHRITGNSEDAADVLQETFLALLQYATHFRGEAKISTWLYRVAIRQAVRMHARRPVAALDADPTAKTPSPHEKVALRQDAEKLAAAMDALPEAQRVCLILASEKELSAPTIAEILGIPEGTVWSRLHLARKALAAAIARCEG